MLGLFILLPLLILFLSIGYLFVDLKKPKAWIIAVVLGVVQLGIFGGLMFLVTWVDADQEALSKKITEQAQNLDEAQRMQNLMLTRLSVDPEPGQKALKYLIPYGFSADNSFIARTKAADAAIEKLRTESKRSSNRTGISVLQIPEETNQALVAEILRQLGYEAYYAPPTEITETDAEELPPEEEKEEVTTTQEADGSITLALNFEREQPKNNAIKQDLKPLKRANVIFVGARVKLQDTKTVALALIRAGIELKHIKRIKKRSAETDRTILVSFKKNYERRPLLTPARVVALKRIR